MNGECRAFAPIYRWLKRNRQKFATHFGYSTEIIVFPKGEETQITRLFKKDEPPKFVIHAKNDNLHYIVLEDANTVIKYLENPDRAVYLAKLAFVSLKNRYPTADSRFAGNEGGILDYNWHITIGPYRTIATRLNSEIQFEQRIWNWGVDGKLDMTTMLKKVKAKLKEWDWVAKNS